MILAENLVEERLNSTDNLALKMGKGNRVNHKDAGRKEGDVNIHPVVRSVISAAARLSTAKEVSEDFNVSPAQVHNLKHGKTTGTGEVKDEILKGADKELEGVRGKAIQILVDSLGFINADKLKDLKATSLTNVAKDMASVIEKTSPKSDANTRPSVVIITAERREIKDYQVIEVESSVVE